MKNEEVVKGKINFGGILAGVLFLMFVAGWFTKGFSTYPTLDPLAIRERGPVPLEVIDSIRIGDTVYIRNENALKRVDDIKKRADGVDVYLLGDKAYLDYDLRKIK